MLVNDFLSRNKEKYKEFWRCLIKRKCTITQCGYLDLKSKDTWDKSIICFNKNILAKEYRRMKIIF